MTKAQILKLKQVLENNRSWPMILSGIDTSTYLNETGEFPLANAIQINAFIPEDQLHKSNALTPLWMNEVDEKTSKTDTSYLVIEGLDTISKEVQKKFIPLIKDRRAGLYKLPGTVQIIIPVADKTSVENSIQSFCLTWDLK